jgi:hypothetical protein
MNFPRRVGNGIVKPTHEERPMQTVDVTGLSPESIRQVESLIESLRAAEQAHGPLPPSQLPYHEWRAWFNSWIASHEKRDIVIDDSRESIYSSVGGVFSGK